MESAAQGGAKRESARYLLSPLVKWQTDQFQDSPSLGGLAASPAPALSQKGQARCKCRGSLGTTMAGGLFPLAQPRCHTFNSKSFVVRRSGVICSATWDMQANSDACCAAPQVRPVS